MNIHARSEAFTRFVGLELKGRIVSQGFTALAVATTLGRSPAAFSRWLNGKLDLPLSVLCEASEVIGVEPSHLIEAAYARMILIHGEPDGFTYGQSDIDEVTAQTELLESASANVTRLRQPVDNDLVTLDENDLLVASRDDGGEPEFPNG